jgi:hypothetical protein
VTHYKGQCYAWDVVNEAFNDDGTYRTDVFYNTIGPEYIPIVFETAAAADPSVKLYYNDYNIESPGSKATSALNLVQSHKARGIKIEGAGLQVHFIVGETPSLVTQTANLESFTALGVEVAYTELDTRHPSLPPSTSALAQQATDYYNTVSACLAGGGWGEMRRRHPVGLHGQVLVDPSRLSGRRGCVSLGCESGSETGCLWCHCERIGRHGECDDGGRWWRDSAAFGGCVG